MRPVRSCWMILASNLARVGFVLAATSVVAVEAQVQAPPDATATADTPVGSSPAKTTKVADLTNRYRFVERYPREDGRDLPGSLGPYRVGLIEVSKGVVDQPQGAPRRSEVTRKSVFVERATEQAGIGGVIGAVRFYEKFGSKPDDPMRTMGPNPLDGLSVATRFRSADWPTVTSLTDRRPTDYEYEVLTRQMVVSQLSQIFSPQALRVGDTWRISRRGTQALLGDPGARGDSLTARFNELLKEVDSPKMIAVISVSGRVLTSLGESAVNAQIHFTFQIEAPGKPTAEGRGGLKSSNRSTEGLLEARGAVTEVRLGRSTTNTLPGPGRLKVQAIREVTMQRQIDPGNLTITLPRFPAPPKLEDPATWLSWVGPSNRFRIDHSQDLLPPERPSLAPNDPNSMALARTSKSGFDLVQLDFVSKPQSIDDLKAKLAAKFAMTKNKVIEGEETWLPEIDWPNNRKVYRIEAAVEIPNQGDASTSRTSRTHFDGYLIQTGQAASVLVIATTTREPVAPFRREVEQVLKTLLLGADSGEPAK